MENQFKIRDLRKKDQFKIDDKYINGYAKLCSVYATAVYNSLSRHAQFSTQECWPSIEKIAEQHNISRPSVIKGIKDLEKWNIIKIDKKKDAKGRQEPNLYLLIDKSNWRPVRVNDIDSANTNPSKRQNKTRVNDIDCKDNKEEKDTKISEQSSPSSNLTSEPLKEKDLTPPKASPPPVKELFEFFIQAVKDEMGFEPEIAYGKEGSLLKQRLKKDTPEEIKSLIKWYLKDKVSDKLGASLGVCLSTNIVNQWLRVKK